MVAPVTALVPRPEDQVNKERRKGVERALEYMGLEGGTPIAIYRCRSSFYWLLHQLSDRGYARSGASGEGQASG